MSSLMRYTPFEDLRALQRQLFGEDDPLAMLRQNLATTDVYTQDDKRLVVEAHLPNFAESDVDVNIDRGFLTIRAEKHEQEEDKSKKYVVRESSSSFYRRVQLPEQADVEGIGATMDNGVLTVTVPFKDLPTPKKVAITGKGAATE